MNAVLYHQKTAKDSRGRIRYIGEDALPYADGDLLIVADGLGGRGGYPHTKVNRKILNRDSFYDFVFAPVFTPSVSEEFKAVVTDEFSELFNTKEYYFESESYIRTSGYFASRLVVSTVLHEFKYNGRFSKDSLFLELKSVPEDSREDAASRIGKELADIIKDKLTRIAENIGLENESRISGAYLLPSTLVAALVDEHEEDVDVLYFWAGDSRGYLWDSEGLAQVTDDHERDETMTNLITLTKPFTIEVRMKTFKKPCLLFNASDGCYKCSVFASPFDLEYVFLQAVADSGSFDEATAALSDLFGVIGTHDDSNTMALAALGYDGFEDVRKAARNRLQTIHDTIVTKLPGILDVDYPAELADVESRMKSALFSVRDRLIEEDAVIAYVKSEMEEADYRPYENEKAKLAHQMKNCVERQKAALSDIRGWLADHWVITPQMKRHSSASDKVITAFMSKYNKKNPYKLYKDLLSELSSAQRDYSDRVRSAITNLETVNAQFFSRLNTLLDISAAADFEISSVSSEIGMMNGIFDLLRSVGKNDLPALQKYYGIQRSILELNTAYADADEVAIEGVLERILAGELNFSHIDMNSDQRDEIQRLIAAHAACQVEWKELKRDVEALPDRFFKQFWKDRYDRILPEIWTNHSELIPDDLKSVITEGMIGLKDKCEELKQALEIRNGIYADYDRLYRRVFEESRL